MAVFLDIIADKTGNPSAKSKIAYCAKSNLENGKVLMIKGLTAAGGNISIEASTDDSVDAFWQAVEIDGDTTIGADGYYTLPAMNYIIRAKYSGLQEAGELITVKLS